ncbi:MAG TPA: phage tail sheath subtilisin-like domain-containing protein [Candidatus Angelobacter sp.]|nr:phage tail sheath subtilisin-like domain-containing protein [Candidatus Angelobacter sp.]
MPVTPTYPGVYIEELPSGVHTITGVATSIAAFIGWAPQGSTTQAELVLSWSDFANQFGGLDSRAALGYAVNQFFANGGTQAYIVRLVGSDAVTASVTVGSGSNEITFKARNQGSWANAYWIAIKNQLDPVTSKPTGRFRVQVVYAPATATNHIVVESFENLGMVSPDPQGRFVIDVINNGSSIVTIDPKTGIPSGATAPPADTAQSSTANPPLPSPPGLFPQPTQLINGFEGKPLLPNSSGFESALDPTTGSAVQLLSQIDLFNLLCVPGETTGSVLSGLEGYCETRRAFLIADPDPTITDYTKVALPAINGAGGNAAYYFPQVQAPDPLNNNVPRFYPPCGFVAGVYAATDASRGVWKAPAGTATGLIGATGVQVPLNDAQNGRLNPLGVNCIRNFSAFGTVIWGARTTQGNDEIGSQWKYVPIRRLALFLEESLYRGTQWVVFEPNDEPLWAQIRLNVGAFMQTLFRQGAFQGASPQQAYFVKCDGETTTSTDQNNGIVNILVGFAPLKPAEFVIIQIQQMAGQTGS